MKKRRTAALIATITALSFLGGFSLNTKAAITVSTNTQAAYSVSVELNDPDNTFITTMYGPASSVSSSLIKYVNKYLTSFAIKKRIDATEASIVKVTNGENDDGQARMEYHMTYNDSESSRVVVYCYYIENKGYSFECEEDTSSLEDEEEVTYNDGNIGDYKLNDSNTDSDPDSDHSEEALAICNTANNYVDTQFSLLGGIAENSFTDISFVYQVLKEAVGVTSQVQSYGNLYHICNTNIGSEHDKGDIMFFADSSGKIRHVGIYMGLNKMIHCTNKIEIVDLSESKLDDMLLCYGRAY